MLEYTAAAERAATFALELAGETRIALGCMGLAGTYGRVDTTVAKRTLTEAFDCGIRLFDAAPLYGEGLAEELLGVTLANKPVTIVTKFGLSAALDGSLVKDSRPLSIRASIESSLRRMRRERIDILLQHRSDPNVPDDDVAEILVRLIEEGKVAHVGLSHASTSRTRRFQALAPIKIVQNEMSAAAAPETGDDALSFANLGTVFMAHSPLARGALAGFVPRHFEADDYRSKILDLDSQAQAISIAKSRGVGAGNASLISEALNWVLAQGQNVIAVVGARTPEQVRKCTLNYPWKIGK